MGKWIDEREQLQKEARQFDRSIKLTTKDGWFWILLSWCLHIFSFGRFNRTIFLTNFATSIAHIQAYPSHWNSQTVRILLPHEGRHCWQFRVCGFGIHPLVGIPLMAILYILFLVPIYLAIFRCWSELDANRYEWRHMLKIDQTENTILLIRTLAWWRAETVASSAYLWAVPKWFAVWWFKREAEKIIIEVLK